MVNSFKYFLSFALLALVLGLFTPKASADGVPTEYEPAAVAGSVYKITAIQGGESQWTGTGFMVGKDLMLSAGHVCDTEGEDGFTFRATGRWNQEYPLKVLKFSRDPDICLLLAQYVPYAKLFDHWAGVPDYGGDLWYSGAPHGVFGDGTVPFARGYYIGGYRMMIAGYPGASGSPVYTKDGLVGILVRGWRGTHMLEFETAAEIYQFLRE